MDAFVKVGSTGWVEVVFIQLSWTVASRVRIMRSERSYFGVQIK
jgi:hypothetical protein